MTEETSYFLRPYLNCRKTIILEWLLSQKITVDFLFYNSYENTGCLYNQIILENKTRFNYKNNTFHDFDLLGIVETIFNFEKFDEAKEYIYSKLRENKPIFIWAATKHIPHMNSSSTYGSHSLSIIGYDFEKNSFTIKDDLYDNLHYKYSVLKKAYDALPNNKKSISVFNCNEYKITNKTKYVFQKRFNQHWIYVNILDTNKLSF